jgi:hypothetical protein
MNWAWTKSLDELWRSPTFPMWLTLAAAGFFGIIVLITMLRAEKSVANGALTVITLLAIGIAVAATIRGFGTGGSGESSGSRTARQTFAVLPALSCIDDLAGETVLTACEKILFGSAEATAAALSYAASLITRVSAFGNSGLTTEQMAARRAVERDRYGLMAYVLAARDHCTASQCAAFQALTDHRQISANIDDRIYDGLVMRYSPSWNAPPVAVAPGPAVALAPSMPTGKPTTADFPSAASTPPVNIMSAEPGTTASAPRTPAAASTAAPSLPRPTAAGPPTPAAAAKKQAATKRASPTPLAPPTPPGAPEPTATDD